MGKRGKGLIFGRQFALNLALLDAYQRQRVFLTGPMIAWSCAGNLPLI